MSDSDKNLVQKEEKNWVTIFLFSWDINEISVDNMFSVVNNYINDNNINKVILNLYWLKYINSKFIWYIVDIFSNIEDNWWKMAITNCNAEVKDILWLVWLTTIIDLYNNTDEAVEAISK